MLHRPEVVASVRRRRLGRLQRLDRDQVLVDPVLVRLLGRDAVLDLLVGDDALLGQVDEEHPAGLQAALLDHLARRHVEHADLRREDHVVVGGHPVAGRAEAVAIEHRADLDAVGEGDAGRAVPGLDEARVVGVERLLLGAHRVVVLPRLGHQHHHGVRQRPARLHEQFQHAVQAGRVAESFANDRQHLLQVVAEQLRGQHRLAGPHPVDVAAQRVDFAVVGDQVVRVRELPARERVGAEARVEQRQRARGPRVAQVGKVLTHLWRREHALVGQRAGGEARDVEVPGVVDAAGADGRLEALPDDVQLALEGGHVGRVGAGREEHMVHHRLDRARRLAEAAVLGRHAAPAEEHLSFLADHHREDQLGERRGLRVGRAEDQADGIPTGSRQRGERLSDLGIVDGALRAFVLEQRVRNLDQDAGAIAGVRLGPGRAAMLHALERAKATVDEVVRGVSAQVREEPDATGIVFERRVVQAALRRRGRLRIVHGAPSLTGDSVGDTYPSGGEACSQCMTTSGTMRFSHATNAASPASRLGPVVPTRPSHHRSSSATELTDHGLRSSCGPAVMRKVAARRGASGITMRGSVGAASVARRAGAEPGPA